MTNTYVGNDTDTASDRAADVAKGAAEVAATARQQAGTVAHTGQQEVKAVARDAKSQARHLMTESREELRTQANAQTSRVAGGLREISSQLQQMADAVDSQDSPVVSVVGQAAATTDRLAGRLDQGGIEGLLDETKRFARNRPGVFLLGALGAGLTMGRLLKGVTASSDSATPGSNGQSFEPDAADVTGASPLTLESSYGGAGISAGYQDPVMASGTGTAVEQGGLPLAGGLPAMPPTETHRHDQER
jgi:hypothetical protein